MGTIEIAITEFKDYVSFIVFERIDCEMPGTIEFFLAEGEKKKGEVVVKVLKKVSFNELEKIYLKIKEFNEAV